MPLMHSENKEDGELCCSTIQTYLIDSCKNEGIDGLIKNFEYNLKFGNDHLDVLLKFGRYPSRNKALERVSTPEEEEFL